MALPLALLLARQSVSAGTSRVGAFVELPRQCRQQSHKLLRPYGMLSTLPARRQRSKQGVICTRSPSDVRVFFLRHVA